ncbi:hypothetical protein ACFE04_004064 [Oxalis oulophora]
MAISQEEVGNGLHTWVTKVLHRYEETLRVDSMCGRFSKGYKRQQKCSEWLETDKFKTIFPEIIRDPDNADSPLDNCIKDQPSMRNPQYIDALIGKNIIVKMFLSPLMLANGFGKKQFYAFQGIDADSIFFCIMIMRLK